MGHDGHAKRHVASAQFADHTAKGMHVEVKAAKLAGHEHGIDPHVEQLAKQSLGKLPFPLDGRRVGPATQGLQASEYPAQSFVIRLRKYAQISADQVAVQKPLR